MSGALRSIFALFDIDTGQALTKLTELEKGTTSVKEALATIAATAFGAFSLHGITEFIESQIELGSVINDTAEKLGVGTEELQKFQYAAAGIGVNGDDAAKALGFLSKNIGDAVGGAKEQAQTFAELGVQLKDAHGNVRELYDVIPEVADAFEKMGSSQERTAASMKLFGKSGAGLVPLLKGGSAEITKASEEFNDLGLVIEEDFIRKADEAGDRIDTVKWGFRALKTHMAAELLPTISDAAKKFSTWVAWAIKVSKETHIVKEAWWGLGAVASIAAGKTLYSWSKVLGLFPKGGSLIGNLFKMGQVGLVIGGLVLLAGAIEDIVVMCQGGESVIGDFLDEFLGVEYRTQLVNDLNQAWTDMQPAIDDLKPVIESLGGTFAKVLPYMIGLVVDLLKVVLSLGNGLFTIGESLGHLVTGDLEGFKKSWLDGADRNESFWKTGSTFYNMITAPQTATGKEAGFIGPPPPPVNLTAENYFQIIGSEDPAETGRRVAGLQRDVNQQAINDAANALATGTE